MKRLLTAGLALVTLSLTGSAFAEGHPTGYQSLAPVSISADPGKTNTAQSDPLTDVTRVDLVVRLKCADETCTTAAFGLSIDDEAGEAAALTFTPTEDGKLQARVTKVGGSGEEVVQAYGLSPKPGESFDLRLHWNNGNRVTLDLYGTNPLTGLQTMESHDIQLDAGIKQLSMRASGGDLTLMKQSYTFR
ncbi:MAG: hypothetical protein QM647_10945 [Asticcacaulis sp.]|uniref:hypothetical protein n=1 Tax=Asticcacaulis sp. TaxID=1872648 RepID=UPI0039E448F6